MCVYNYTTLEQYPISKTVHSLVSPATGVTEEDDDQTGDSGMGTGSCSAQYLMTDFLPGMQLYKHHSHLGKGRGGWNAVY